MFGEREREREREREKGECVMINGQPLTSSCLVVKVMVLVSEGEREREFVVLQTLRNNRMTPTMK